MRPIETRIDIDAPRTVVWEILTDLSSYPAWNPHLVRATGTLDIGSDLDITVRREGSKDREMTVTVTEYVPERRLEWVGTLVSPWVFEGRHTFELDVLDDAGARTRLHNREDLSGVLASFVTTDTPEVDYERMNRAVKSRAERVATAD